jgi:hypothetical protein
MPAISRFLGQPTVARVSNESDEENRIGNQGTGAERETERESAASSKSHLDRSLASVSGSGYALETAEHFPLSHTYRSCV